VCVCVCVCACMHVCICVCVCVSVWVGNVGARMDVHIRAEIIFMLPIILEKFYRLAF
jgi:hypothetical protein